MHEANIVILTGAGISAESGLDTFRDSGGLWARYRIEDVATPQAFRRDPALVQDFYNMRRAELARVAPNPAHDALARLEAAHQGGFLLVTQNVDDLHERAGSRNVLHMHGELLKARCLACGHVAPWHGPIEPASACPACGATRLRPHIVWFGEYPLGLDRIESALAKADLFLSIGTSGAVYPAAGFVATLRSFGRAHCIEINLEPSEGSHHFHEKLHGKAGQLVPELVERLLAG